mmetsp:Transcript_1914/g.3866  ORF Transcript_1914/g.3866 Transcript_1914/m.3866 type:complete len:248 (+) Transcript_1914:2-745(+)
MKLLEGHPAGQLEARGPTGWKRQLTLYYLHRHAGFSKGYFHNEFLDGAGQALTHAADVLPGSVNILDKALQQIWSDGVRETQEAGLRLAWKIEEVTAASLGSVRLVFGVRRRELPPADPAFRTEVFGHCVVMSGDRRAVTATDLAKMLRRGATLSAEAHLTCRQSVTLWKPTEDSTAEETVAHTFSEEAVHCLNLEAELLGVTLSKEADPEAAMNVAVEFDEDHGWLVSDINGALEGNCIAKTIPSE